jgi:hypothetical protein
MMLAILGDHQIRIVTLVTEGERKRDLARDAMLIKFE